MAPNGICSLARLALVMLALVACQDSDVSRAVGARCVDSSECDDRCLPPSGDWPGGFCTVHCEVDLDCPGLAVCIEEEGGICAFACSADPGCLFLGNGYKCVERDARGGAGKRMVCRGS
jgi:hypothetical protein